MPLVVLYYEVLCIAFAVSYSPMWCEQNLTSSRCISFMLAPHNYVSQLSNYMRVNYMKALQLYQQNLLQISLAISAKLHQPFTGDDGSSDQLRQSAQLSQFNLAIFMNERHATLAHRVSATHAGHSAAPCATPPRRGPLPKLLWADLLLLFCIMIILFLLICQWNYVEVD